MLVSCGYQLYLPRSHRFNGRSRHKPSLRVRDELSRVLPHPALASSVNSQTDAEQRIGDRNAIAPDVFVLKRPLVGFEAVESALGPAFPHELALHCMVAIRYPSQKVGPRPSFL